MKLKRFFKRGLQKAIANDFKNLVEDKTMAMPFGKQVNILWSMSNTALTELFTVMD